MGLNDKVIYSFKSSSSQLSNYKIYGSDKYAADYKIYGNTIDGSSVGDLKNLANPNELQQGYYGYADGVAVLGDPYWACTQKIPCKSSTYYTFSFNNPAGSVGFIWYDTSDVFISSSHKDRGFTNGGYYTAESPSNAAYFIIDIGYHRNTGITFNVDDVINLMVVEGSTPSEYEPYGYKIPIRVTGKNLLKSTTNQTSNGVTFTVNSDGSVTCNGTASADAFYSVFLYLQKGSYIISGCPQNGSANSYMITMRNGNGDHYSGINGDDTGTGKTIITTEYLYFSCIIRIASGYTCDNLTFYPMIRRADIEDDTYEPYEEQIEYLYLDSPLTKSGDNCDYIDFKEQKRVNIDGTTEYIKLPEFNVSENSSIFVDTDTQPSNIDFDISHGVGDRTKNLFNPENFLVNHAFIKVNISKVDNRCIIYTRAIKDMTYTVILQHRVTVIESVFTIDEPQNGISYSINGTTTWMKHGQNISSASRKNDYDTANYIAFQIRNVSEVPTAMIIASSIPPENYEPYGYKIPVKVQGKNLFDSSVDQGGINSANGEEHASGQYYTNRLRSEHIYLTGNKVYTISSNMNIKIIVAYYNNEYISRILNANNNYMSYTFTLPINANNIRIVYWSGVNNVAIDPSDFEWCQIEQNATATEYEEPFSSINNIYLNKPLLKDGNNYDYIDYSEQKRYNLDGTIENISSPNVLTNNGMNILTFDTIVQPLKSTIKYINAAAEIPVVDKLKPLEINFTTSDTQLINYQIWGNNGGVGDTNLFDFDAWWENVEGNTHGGTIVRGPNKSFTITPIEADAFTRPYTAGELGYRILVEPNTSYTLSWNKECANSSYYGRQMIFLNGSITSGDMFESSSISTTLTVTTKSDTSFIMLRFGCGANNVDTPITFSNIKFCKTVSNLHVLVNMRDMNDITVWNSQLVADHNNTVGIDNNVISSIIDTTDLNNLYITGDPHILYNGLIRIGKSNNVIATGSTITTVSSISTCPAIIDVSDCNYILISMSKYGKPTTFNDIRSSFKIYTTPPNNTLITLPRQLMKTDNGCDYIDYSEQKLYNMDNTVTNITIPHISTVIGKNKLRLPQDIKPSKILIKYKK